MSRGALFQIYLCSILLSAIEAPVVFAAGAMTVSPASTTLTISQTVTLSVGNAGAQGVRWAVSPSVGTLAVTGGSAVYTAPAAIAQPQTIQIKATSVAAPATSVTSTVTLAPNVTVAVSPGAADLVSGNQMAFQAAVSGTSNTAVIWSASPASLGTISMSGVYTPAAITADATVTVTATSLANAAKSGSATVRLHGNSLYFTTQANGLQSVMFGGVNYNYHYGEGLVTSLTYSAANRAPATSAPVCKSGFTASAVTQQCSTGGDSANVSVTYTTPSPATLTATIQITNNSTTDTITNASFSTLGVQMTQWNLAQSHMLPVDAVNPVSYVNYGTGQWAAWINAPSPGVSMGVTCGWSNVCKNQPVITNIAPGQTKSAAFSLRFSNDTSLQPNELVPEAYTAFEAAYPPAVNWPDRRPIMAWFISDNGKTSATNPRGYLQQPNIDVSNIPSFKAQALAQARSIITQMKARPVQPQGLLIWDLEGQEFIQPTTYVGDPRVLSEGYAPEMDATADDLFALFKTAGYKVGVTLRPQQMQWGKQLPATCQYNADNNYKDYYIKVDNPVGQRFFACYDPAGVNWSLIPKGNGGQTFYPPVQSSSVTSLLMAKVAYAHARWGATLFYVDTAVWVGGAPLPADTFRQLQLAFPDSIFIPEGSNLTTMGVGMPFSDPKNVNAPDFAPLTWRYAYPSGGLGIYLSNCVGECWSSNVSSFDIGQKVGDIAMYTEPTQMSPAQLNTIEAMIQKARSEASMVTVTDSSAGGTYAYKGIPETIYKYPVKMRVYFAASPALANASSTYCEAGGLLGTTSCSLNLSGLTTAQIRYYDFTGQLVESETPQPR